ncbi:hypothetical protein Tco_0800312 [Tanacetum coccineum]|uniref:Uncharacterized protein n=1 Tax=Tanacetum coccineum TaxID=301880 RepID=A0ABQ4ZSS0_9ASTR
MASSHNQAIVDAGSENHPPMLEKGSYVPWSSRFMTYIDGKKEYGKLLKDSIENGDFDYETQSFEIQGDTTNDDPTDNLTTERMPWKKQSLSTIHTNKPTVVTWTV